MPHYRVKIAHGPWPAGHVFTGMQGNTARTLMARGLVEEVGKAVAAPVNRAMSAPEIKGKRRQNKDAA